MNEIRLGSLFDGIGVFPLAAHFVGCTPDRAGYEKALGDVDVSRYFAGLQKDEMCIRDSLWRRNGLLS